LFDEGQFSLDQIGFFIDELLLKPVMHLPVVAISVGTKFFKLNSGLVFF
jgi:hypothetical protein